MDYSINLHNSTVITWNFVSHPGTFCLHRFSKSKHYFMQVFISIGILAGAVTNFFYFMQANKGKNMLIVGRQKAQYDLKRKLGVDLIRRLKNASVVTYI